MTFLTFYDQHAPGGERLSFSLSRSSGGPLLLQAWAWSDSQGQLVLVGSGALPEGCPSAPPSTGPGGGIQASRSFACDPAAPAPIAVIEFEWDAGATPGSGSLRVFMRPARADAPFVHATSRRAVLDGSLLFQGVSLDTGSQSLNHMELGVRAAQHAPGTFGTLRIDEIAVYR